MCEKSHRIHVMPALFCFIYANIQVSLKVMINSREKLHIYYTEVGGSTKPHYICQKANGIHLTIPTGVKQDLMICTWNPRDGLLIFILKASRGRGSHLICTVSSRNPHNFLGINYEHSLYRTNSNEAMSLKRKATLIFQVAWTENPIFVM